MDKPKPYTVPLPESPLAGLFNEERFQVTGFDTDTRKAGILSTVVANQ